MKLRTLLEAIGVRKRPQVYGHRIDTFELEREGTVRFAQWLHPKCRPMHITQHEIDQLRPYIRTGDGILDIGAHAGDTSVLFALAAGPEGRVFAVEPNRYVIPVLEANAGLNPQAAPIQILPYAATKTAMSLVFDYSDAGFCNGGDLSSLGKMRGGHLYRLDVEGRNIASELALSAPEWSSKIRFVKTDTEGNDQSVIESLANLIRSARPYLLCEVYKRSSDAQRRSFHSLLTSDLGYRVYRSEPYSRLKLEELGADDMNVAEHFDIFCIPKDDVVR